MANWFLKFTEKPSMATSGVFTESLEKYEIKLNHNDLGYLFVVIKIASL